MGEGIKQMFHETATMSRMEDEEELSDSNNSSGTSISSSSSSDLTDDASSPSSTSGSPQLDSNGPLYELSSLMAQLPIKRGLSKFFQGKSQSFTSLCNVRCMEDLAKKETPYRKRRMEPCASYGGGFDLSNRSYYVLGPHSKTISKKASRGSWSSLAVRRSNGSIFVSAKPPSSIPVQKNM